MTPNQIDSAQGTNTPRLLVVDDDVTVCLAAQTMLGEEGFEVITCDNGEDAVRLVESENPDLVMLDVNMPQLNGYDVCRAIRKEHQRHFLPVLIMTSKDDLEAVEHAYHVGATDFITKPINYMLLSFRVRHLLRAHANLRLSQDQRASLESVQHIAKLGFWIWDVNKDELSINAESAKLLGLESDEKSHYLLSDLTKTVHPTDLQVVRNLYDRLRQHQESFSIEHRILKRGRVEHIIFQETEVHYLESGRRTSVVGIIQDITDRKKAEERIFNLAYYDHLTGLPNRTFLKEHLNMVLDSAARKDYHAAVVSVNLDQFARINDSFGYDFGDELLRRVSNRLSVGLRQSDCISHMLPASFNQAALNQRIDALARVDSNQFSIVLSEISKPEVAATVCQRILKLIKNPFEISRHKIVLGCTIGISVYPENGLTVEDLVGNAEAALNYAKSEARGGFLFFSQDMNDAARQRLEMENDLRVAIKEKQFELFYQPKVDVQTQKVRGMEALIRWFHPEKGMVSPSAFIPLAEESELILEIGEWVLRQACQDSLAWRDYGLDALVVSVNVSAKQFSMGDFSSFVARILEETNLPPNRLELEITEGTLVKDVSYAVSVLAELKALGVRVSLDDFGTGYSSFSYVKDFPIDTLKIDRSFLLDVPGDSASVAIVRAIISLSLGLNLNVVAEGVEEKEQLDLIIQSGCHQVQGYIFSKPVSFKDFITWVKNAEWRSLFLPSTLIESDQKVK